MRCVGQNGLHAEVITTQREAAIMLTLGSTHCRNTLQVDDQFAGRVIVCPHCGGHIQAGVVVIPPNGPPPLPTATAEQPENPLAFLEGEMLPPNAMASPNPRYLSRPSVQTSPAASRSPSSFIGNLLLLSGIAGLLVSCYWWLGDVDTRNKLLDALQLDQGRRFILSIFVCFILPGLAGTATLAGAILVGFASLSKRNR